MALQSIDIGGVFSTTTEDNFWNLITPSALDDLNSDRWVGDNRDYAPVEMEDRNA